MFVFSSLVFIVVVVVPVCVFISITTVSHNHRDIVSLFWIRNSHFAAHIWLSQINDMAKQWYTQHTSDISLNDIFQQARTKNHKKYTPKKEFMCNTSERDSLYFYCFGCWIACQVVGCPSTISPYCSLSVAVVVVICFFFLFISNSLLLIFRWSFVVHLHKYD